MSLEHYSLAKRLIREIGDGAIRVRFGDGTVDSFQLAFEFGCDSTTALWALRLLCGAGWAELIGEKSYGAEIYRIFTPGTVVSVPAPRQTFLN